MKFDKIDKKLIAYLYHNYRKPITQIAKACRISREQAEYRIKKYESEFIKQYITVFNYNLLGYNEFVIVWMKTKNKQQITSQLEQLKNTVSVGEVITHHDLFVNLIFKNKEEFEKTFYSFLEKNKEKILSYDIFISTFIEFYPLKAFDNLKEEQTYSVVHSAESIKLKEKDLAILKILEKNGRARIIDIAKQTKLSSELIVYKLKQFYKKNIIFGTRIQFDMDKLGYDFATLKLKLKNLSIKEKLRTFCKEHKNINALALGISEYNGIIQIFYQKDNELRQTIRDINKRFEQDIENTEVLLIEQEGRVKTLPL